MLLTCAKNGEFAMHWCSEENRERLKENEAFMVEYNRLTNREYRKRKQDVEDKQICNKQKKQKISQPAPARDVVEVLEDKLKKYFVKKIVDREELDDRDNLIQQVKVVLNQDQRDELLKSIFANLIKEISDIHVCHEGQLIEQVGRWWQYDAPWWVWKFRLFLALKNIPSFMFEPKTVERSQSMYKVKLMMQEEMKKRGYL